MKHPVDSVSNHQISVNVLVAMELALVAGAIEADSFVFHGNIFASLQSGNLIMLGVNLVGGHWLAALHRIVPLMAFFITTMLVRWRQHQTAGQDVNRLITRLFLGEGFLLAISMGINSFGDNWPASCLLASAAAIQLQTVRTVNGQPFNSTMMTGNVRLSAVLLTDALLNRQWEKLSQSRHLVLIWLSFGIGAACFALLVPLLQQWSLLPGVMILIAVIPQIIKS
ncbi:YoaK family protein [Furfurilactobacillus siliginis]|uniref:Membrane protein n=1 Tax=Furfurilactobacillus siliginis TaxID=348151 RepID=A0A0R2L5H5_9LACO|nr:YoaK family protein [Furfurilactobacillus siliginis]KRN96974.1 hypothetical protein IV55_GL000849 [Furfurilactobacillus siliginis]GEK27733.1 membrane protein [Furfurilactobacillus siliginis]